MRVRYGHWIGGLEAPPLNGHYLPTSDPVTRLAGDEVAAGTAADVELAVASSVRVQQEWARRSGAERAEVLESVASAMDAHHDELVDLEKACTGKVPGQLKLEADSSAAYFRYYAGVLRSVGGRTIDHGAASHVYTRLEPYGVVGVITPWNLPLNQACRALAPALAVGNTAVIKPSELTSISTLHMARLASDAGLPPGVLNVVTGTGPDVGTPLALDPRVQRIAFTGSVATGRKLAAIAADRLIPMTLELGGKSPLVAFADADLDRVVAAAVSAVAVSSGQVCSATTRVLIQEAVHDEVAARIVDAVRRLEPGVDFGPIISETQFEKVREHFLAAREEGLFPAVGGAPYADGTPARGRYIQPTVYVGVSPKARIAREEVFGPVLVTLPFIDEEHVLSLANDTEYGLVASVWSGDLARGLRLAERIDAGQVSVNGGPLTIETPFGGFKQSGYGREKGLEALHDYCQIKTVSLSIEK